jgi:hypothetical protein
MNDTTSEAQLLWASVAGSKDAFGTVVRRYQALVCAVTYSATGDIGTSEELAQETFLRAWRNLRQLEDPGWFRAWLCTIALTGIVGDWMAFAAIVVCDLATLWGATAVCLHRPQRYWSAALLAVSAVIAVTLVAINLRWNVWMNAYRQSSAYDARNDVSLVAINEIVLGLYIALALSLAWRHVGNKKHHGRPPGRHDA